MKLFSDFIYDNERALYGLSDICVSNCVFDGPADGESALKECSDIIVENCRFHLRYPLWHVNRAKITTCEMNETCRAPLWYSEHIHISDSDIHGVKALRECSDVTLEHCSIISPEFGWFTHNISVNNCDAEGEYMFMRSDKLSFRDFEMKGKYSFQYIHDAVFENCTFDTKDAFWHAKNVYVKNCTVNGEYLGWYSENVTFENCILSGTQPLCYCKDLKLINCEMHGADLAFEKSAVDAHVTSNIISIKNPLSGSIRCTRVEQIILDDPHSQCEILSE